MGRNTVARIDLGALAHNLTTIRSRVGPARIACVIKADGYGHGITRVARALSGTDLFAVATPGEAIAVREAGWQGRLLLLEGFSNRDAFELSRALDLELVVHQHGQLALLREQGCTQRQRLWLKVDTGMHRLGFAEHEAGDLLRELAGIPGAGAPILMSHFACADDPSDPSTLEQLRRFDALPGAAGFEQSLANSAALLHFPQSIRDYARPGIMLYGISPLPGATGAEHGLRPAMTLTSELIAINPVREGERVGYGGEFTCHRDSLIGVVAIGYGDGYPRHLESGTPVLVNGRRAALAGRVSMDLITIDLSAHPGAQVGDEVVLWGPQLPVEEVAAQAGSIPYELVCGVTGRVDRVEV